VNSRDFLPFLAASPSHPPILNHLALIVIIIIVVIVSVNGGEDADGGHSSAILRLFARVVKMCENVKHRRHCHHDLCHRRMANFMKTMMNAVVQLLVASTRRDAYQIQLLTQCSIFLSENT